MTYVLLSDIHFGAKSNSDKFNQECLDFLEFVRDWCDENLDGEEFQTIFAGDWHHVRNTTNNKTLCQSTEGMFSLSNIGGTQTYMILGNHDLYHLDRRDIHSIIVPDGALGIQVITEPVKINDNMLLVPWMIGNENLKDLITEHSPEYVVGHFEIPSFHFNKKVKRIDMKNPAIRDLIDIPSPDELGQDLVSDIIGGVSKYGYPLLIVDLGTASKVLYIDERGKFVNCNILPGLGLCRESLAKNASLLPKIELRVPETVLANNTIDAMNTGLVYGHAHMIEGIVSRYEQELNKKIKTVITGGYLNLLKPLFEKDFIIDFNLTMEGIYNIYKLENLTINKSSKK